MTQRSVPAAFAVLVVALLAACATPARTPSVLAPASPITGVVTSIDSRGLADVRSFVLRTADAKGYSVRVGNLENGAEFPPGHLAEHMSTGVPIRVFFRVEGGELVAYRIEDAG